MKNEETELGPFATALMEGLEAKGMSMMDLAKALPNDVTYEHVRKLCRGEANPSTYINQDICKILGLKAADMWNKAQTHKLRKNKHFAQIIDSASGKSDRVRKIEDLIDKVTDEQFELVLGQLEGWAKRNRR